MIFSLRGPLTPREGAGSLPALLLDQGPLPEQPTVKKVGTARRRSDGKRDTFRRRSGPRRRKEKVMDAREDTGRQLGGDDAVTTRIGALALPIGVVLIAISEVFHPSRQDPMDFPAVFREYAQSDIWTTVHFGEYFGFLFLLGGLVALYYSVSARPGLGAGLAPFGLAAAVTTAASFTVLQAVDGVTLRYTIHNWVSAPASQKPAAFAAAKVARWTEIGLNGFSYFLAGLTLLIFGLP